MYGYTGVRLTWKWNEWPFYLCMYVWIALQEMLGKQIQATLRAPCLQLASLRVQSDLLFLTFTFFSVHLARLLNIVHREKTSGARYRGVQVPIIGGSGAHYRGIM